MLLLDTSGSMERVDRVRIRQECLRVLVAQLRPEDRVSVVSFARTSRLWVDGLPGHQASEVPERLAGLIPEGGTNLEEALALAYQSAKRHFIQEGLNRVALLTDGAANLGEITPDSLRRQVEAARKQGIALDCFGIGWDGLNDELLEALSRNGDGRYGFVNTPEAASTEFAGQLAGALKVAAFSEWLISSPFAGEVTPDTLLTLLKGVPEIWPLDPRPKQLEQMLGQARTFSTR